MYILHEKAGRSSLRKNDYCIAVGARLECNNILAELNQSNFEHRDGLHA